MPATLVTYPQEIVVQASDVHDGMACGDTLDLMNTVVCECWLASSSCKGLFLEISGHTAIAWVIADYRILDTFMVDDVLQDRPKSSRASCKGQQVLLAWFIL